MNLADFERTRGGAFPGLWHEFLMLEVPRSLRSRSPGLPPW